MPFIVCERCQGTGVIERYNPMSNDWISDTCPVCDGAKFIILEESLFCWGIDRL